MTDAPEYCGPHTAQEALDETGEKEVAAHLQLWRYGLCNRAEIRHGVAVCAFGIAESYLMEEAECRKMKTLLQ